MKMQFCRFLKVCRDGEEVTATGKSFQVTTATYNKHVTVKS